MRVHAVVDSLWHEVDVVQKAFEQQGYTHTVLIWAEDDLLDMVDFKNEFSATTFADSINIKGEYNANLQS